MKQISSRVEDEIYQQVELFAADQRAADTSRTYSMSDAIRDILQRGLVSWARARATSKRAG